MPRIREIIPEINWEALKSEFYEFKKTDEYRGRENQLKFSPFARKIIKKLIEKNEISNEQLTALVQIFACNCTEDNFKKYLKELNFSEADKEEIFNEFINLKNNMIVGYTGRGLQTIRGLNKEQLGAVKNLLVGVYKSTSKNKIKKIVSEYQNKKIPKVRVGIFSPWLYYLKPEICPLVAGSVKEFLLELGGDANDYSWTIDLFDNMKEEIDVKDLGLLDAFLYKKERWEKILIQKSTNSISNVLNSINTKPFIILSGISGTGKTQIARIISAGLVKGGNNGKK